MASVPPREATAHSSWRSRVRRKGTAEDAASRQPPTASQLANATAAVMHSTWRGHHHLSQGNASPG